MILVAAPNYRGRGKGGGGGGRRMRTKGKRRGIMRKAPKCVQESKPFMRQIFFFFFSFSPLLFFCFFQLLIFD